MRSFLRLRRLDLQRTWGSSRPVHSTQVRCARPQPREIVDESAGETEVIPNVRDDPALLGELGRHQDGFKAEIPPHLDVIDYRSMSAGHRLNTLERRTKGWIPDHPSSSTTPTDDRALGLDDSAPTPAPGHQSDESISDPSALATGTDYPAESSKSAQARYEVEQSEEQTLQRLMHVLEPLSLSDDLEQTSRTRRQINQFSDYIWTMFMRLTLPTRQSFPPDTLRLIMQVAAPKLGVPTTHRRHRYKDQMRRSEVIQDRLRTIINLLEYNSHATPSDYAEAMSRIAILGDAVTVSQIHQELLKMHPVEKRESTIASRSIMVRLTAIDAWCRAIATNHGTSIKRAWNMSLENRNRISGGSYAQLGKKRKDDWWKPIRSIEEEDTIQRASEEVLSMLWSTLADFNSHPETFDEETMRGVLRCLDLLRTVLSKRVDGEVIQRIDKMMLDVLEGPFGVDTQYIAARTDFTGGRGMFELNISGLTALVDLYGWKGEVYKMISAMEIFGGTRSNAQAQVEQEVAGAGEFGQDGTGERYFDSAREAQDQEQDHTVEVDLTSEKVEGGDGAEMASGSVMTSAESSNSVAQGALGSGDAPANGRTHRHHRLVRSRASSTRTHRKTLQRRHSKVKTSRVYRAFHPSSPGPSSVMQSILPVQSQLSPNISAYPLDGPSTRSPSSSAQKSDLASNIVFRRMLDHAIAADDWRAVLLVLRMYVDTAIIHQNDFLRQVITRHLGRATTPGAETTDLEGGTADVGGVQGGAKPTIPWHMELETPRTILSGRMLAIVQAYGRKRFHTINAHPSLMLDRIKPILRDCIKRLREEHLILTGREPDRRLDTPQNYREYILRGASRPVTPSAATGTDSSDLDPRPESGPSSASTAAPLYGIFSEELLPGQDATLVFKLSRSGSGQPFNARAYTWHVHEAWRFFNEILTNSNVQASTHRLGRKRRARVRVEWAEWREKAEAAEVAAAAAGREEQRVRSAERLAREVRDQPPHQQEQEQQSRPSEHGST